MVTRRERTKHTICKLQEQIFHLQMKLMEQDLCRGRCGAFPPPLLSSDPYGNLQGPGCVNRQGARVGAVALKLPSGTTGSLGQPSSINSGFACIRTGADPQLSWLCWAQDRQERSWPASLDPGVPGVQSSGRQLRRDEAARLFSLVSREEIVAPISCIFFVLWV